eukprot:SAG11_NODE_1200_length_5538_cov_8.582460_6_plen_56_part_00
MIFFFFFFFFFFCTENRNTCALGTADLLYEHQLVVWIVNGEHDNTGTNKVPRTTD